MPYNALHVVPPAWGLGIDENDSGIGIDVSHVMCCHEPEDDFGWVLEDEQKPQVNVEEARTESEQTVIDMFHPVWYSRRDGYQGTVSFHFFPESIRDGVGIKADYRTFPTDHSTYCLVLTIDFNGYECAACGHQTMPCVYSDIRPIMKQIYSARILATNSCVPLRHTVQTGNRTRQRTTIFTSTEVHLMGNSGLQFAPFQVELRTGC